VDEAAQVRNSAGVADREIAELKRATRDEAERASAAINGRGIVP